MQSKNKGYTVVELLFVFLAISAIIGILLGTWTLSFGNEWYNEESVLKHLQKKNPEITEIIESQRNVFLDSKIMVREKDQIVIYYLDSNIFYNYEFKKETP